MRRAVEDENFWKVSFWHFSIFCSKPDESEHLGRYGGTYHDITTTQTFPDSSQTFTDVTNIDAISGDCCQMSGLRPFQSYGLQWGELLEILSYLTLKEVYRCIGRLNRAGFIIFLRERAWRRCPTASIGRSRFICRGLNHKKVLLASYPRSGNSFLRKVLESSLGIVTGSDSRTNRTLSESLLQCGFKGEGVVDDSIWVVKTHYPERMGYRKFSCSRVVLLVRNPFDAIESYFYMGMTNTHNKRLSSKAFDSLRHLWPEFVSHEAKIWTVFHEFWLRVSKFLPVLLVRYEDLLTRKDEVMRRIFDFMCDGGPPTGLERFLEEDLKYYYTGMNRTSSSLESKGVKGSKDTDKVACNNRMDVSEDDAAVSTSNISSKSISVDTAAFGNDTRTKGNDSTTDCATDNSTKQQSNGSAVGPGYQPKGGAVGKGLRLLDDSLVACVVERAGAVMDIFGYDLIRHNNDTSVSSNSSNSSNCSNNNGNSSSSSSNSNNNSNSSGSDINSNKIDEAARTNVSKFTLQTRQETMPPAVDLHQLHELPSPSNMIDSEAASLVWTSTALRSITNCSSDLNNCSNRSSNSSSSSAASATGTATGSIPGLVVGLSYCNDSTHPWSISVNETFSIRADDDKFGRRMTDLRRSMTNNDKEPFETASNSNL